MTYINTQRERAELQKSDMLDGSCARKKDFADSNDASKVVLIDTPVGRSSVSVWRHIGHLHAPLPENMFSEGAKVGYLRGTSIAKLLVAKQADATLVSFLKPDLGIKTLAAGRVDYWVGFTATVKFLAEKLGLNVAIVKVANVGTSTLYPFLNKKHKNLVEPLSKELDVIFLERGQLVE